MNNTTYTLTLSREHFPALKAIEARAASGSQAETLLRLVQRARRDGAGCTRVNITSAEAQVLYDAAREYVRVSTDRALRSAAQEIGAKLVTCGIVMHSAGGRVGH